MKGAAGICKEDMPEEETGFVAKAGGSKIWIFTENWTLSSGLSMQLLIKQ
jgi:hypothetical protein